MTYTTLLTSLENGIFTITMNRPSQKNAMSSEMVIEVTKALREAANDETVAFTILTGAGDYYSSGKDLKDFSMEFTSLKEYMRKEIQIIREFIAAFIDFPKLLIAIVNGPAIGAAVTTLALCDLVFCSSTATFWTPFSTLGMCAEGCSSYLFPRVMGFATANKMLQFAQKIDAKEAKQCGLVTDVYEPEDIHSVLMPKIKSAKQNLSQESLITNKKLMRKWNKEKLHKVSEAECDELEKRFTSDNFFEFVSKSMKVKEKKNKL